MDEIGRNYLTLTLNIDRHFEGFVDAYFGPSELKTQAQTGEPCDLAALADDARQLQAAIKASDYDPQRKDFLTRQTRASAAFIHSLAGEQLDYVEEVELYFDITPEMLDEALFESALAEMDRLLPGKGSLTERMTTWKKGLEVGMEQAMPMFDLARHETRRRTLALYDLPPGEDVSMQLVKDETWSAYNWYLGDYQSRIDFNTDLPVRADSAVPLMAHEGYAGHHTEHVLKEHLLYKKQGRGEHAVQLLFAPECVLSEGLANLARKLLFSDEELAAFLRDELYPLAGLSGVDVETQLRLGKAAEALKGLGGNAALLLHRDGRPLEEVQQYLQRYGLRTPQEAAQSLKFIQHPLSRSYIFNYSVGEVMLAPLLDGPDAVENFGRLLTEPLTPTQARQWLAKRKTA